MSALIISTLAAAAFAAVPPSIGSEPIPVNFDYVVAPAQHVALEGPSLAASLGSEPSFVVFDVGSSSVPKPGLRVAGLPALAASLGSEPFVIGLDETAATGTPRVDERESDERLACTCVRK